MPDEGAEPAASGERRRAASSSAGTNKGDKRQHSCRNGQLKELDSPSSDVSKASPDVPQAKVALRLNSV